VSPNPVSSNPILRTTLVWAGVVTAVLAIVGGAIGFFVGGVTGLWAALLGVLIGALFLAITAISILIANRWFGDPLFVPIFFGIVLGGWILKFVVFLVILLAIRGQGWFQETAGIFFFALVAGVVASLVVDAVVVMRMRVPAVDVELPTDPDAGDRTDGS
jgi:hypothetical protein